MGRFEGCYGVVTGGASGIGLATARAFIDEGATVGLIDCDGDAVINAARSLDESGHRVIPVQADVSDHVQVERAFAELPFPEITMLVNSAGIREVVSFQDLDVSEWERVIAVDLHGVFYCCKSAYPLLRKPGGAIVNVSSVAGIMGVPRRVAYSAAKHGVIGLTRGLADDLGTDGVRVNAVCPGVTETPLTHAYFDDEQIISDLRRVTPLGRWAMPEEVAAFIVFLCSDAASFCTGGVFAVDGGYTATKGFG